MVKHKYSLSNAKTYCINSSLSPALLCIPSKPDKSFPEPRGPLCFGDSTESLGSAWGSPWELLGQTCSKRGARAQQSAKCKLQTAKCPLEHLERSKFQTAFLGHIWSTVNFKVPSLGTSGAQQISKCPPWVHLGEQQTAACPPWAQVEDPGLELCLSQSQHSPHTPWVLSRPAVTSGGISQAQHFTLSLAPREFFSLPSQLGIPGNQE